MMREFKKYDEYKESGIEWMDNIPKNWDILENKYIFRYRKNYKNREEDTPVLSLTINGVKLKKELSFGKSTESYIGHQLVYPGELVFTPRDFDQTPILSGVSKDYGCISNLYFVLDSNERAINEYINYYWWGLKYGYDYFRNFSTGLRYSFNRAEFDRIPFICPSIVEQKNILKFLDLKTAKLDKIINKKEKLIDHLEKYKKSVITEAVTKGKLGDKYINEDGELVDEIEMKDSGVEWLGEIPVYWDIKKVKHSFQVINGSTPKTSNESYWDGNIVWITPADLDDNKKYISNSSRKITFEGLNSCSTNLIPKNNLIISSRAPIGYISINKVEVSTNQGCKSLVKISDENTEFYYYYFLSIRKVLNYYGNGTTFTELSAADLSQVDIISLNKNIQNIIINYLSEKTEEIDDFINKTKKSIDKYKEYKKSLIFEAVTGKIDLRDYELEGGEEIAEHNNSR
jgi:type I restriction enzyme S subunit